MTDQLCQKRFACAKDAQSAVINWRGKQTVCYVDANVAEMVAYKCQRPS
jgi:hypothetical protein